MVGAVICGAAIGTVALCQPDAPAVVEVTSTKQLLLELLSDIHSSDEQTAIEAEQRLIQLGITQEQFDFAQYLKHPNRRERLRLAQMLDQAPETVRDDLRAELLRDPDLEVRKVAQGIKEDPSLFPAAELTREVSTADATEVPQQPHRKLSGKPRLVADTTSFAMTAFSSAAGETAPGSAAALIEDDELFKLTAPSSKKKEGGVRPNFLERPDESESLATIAAPTFEEWIEPEPVAPYGFTGPSGIGRTEVQESPHFVPQPDRWRAGFEPSDRYGKGHPWVDDYHGVEGHWWDPYNQNVLKGDFPIYGQHTFFSVTGTSATSINYRQVPTATSPFESTQNPGEEEFFGNPNQFFVNQNFFLKMALFHANDAAFKPLDWQVAVTPVVNFNSLQVQELAVVNPNVEEGKKRNRDDVALQEYFVEAKLADLSPNYDFASLRVGSQSFNSDFRSFIFNDTNRGARLFGTNFANRHQFNLVYFDMLEKDTNSQLNTYEDRHQNVLVANYYIQDFIFPGYTAQTSFHLNNDQPSFRFDDNNFLARPDPAGVFQPHRVEAYYLGFAGDGHIGRVNVSNAFYWATGRDSLNPIGGRELDINAYMAAVELSYDRDWARFRSSFFWSSGDGDPYDEQGSGFDTIMDNPNFAGGNFSYWQRQAIGLFGVQLVNQNSLVPNLRSSKTQGQSNFTNPGLLLFNVGFDADITPKLRMVNNANYLMFDQTEVLQQFVFANDVGREIGLDLSSGFEWRPFHNDNMVVVFGVSSLIPGEGFKDLYGTLGSTSDVGPLMASFFELNLVF